jgi:hypothetical protein
MADVALDGVNRDAREPRQVAHEEALRGRGTPHPVASPVRKTEAAPLEHDGTLSRLVAVPVQFIVVMDGSLLVSRRYHHRNRGG